jgi:predicted naringenin-chalcone synthase
VLARVLPAVTRDRVATFAFGPGVTVEWGLLRRAG